MCGRFTLTQPDVSSLAKKFKISAQKTPKLKARYNSAPGQAIPVIAHYGKENTFDGMEWGLVPAWAKDHTMRFINARAETLAEKPSFRDSFRYHRCLIPADGFYEWSTHEKQPYYIRLRTKDLFLFAGIYAVWHSNDGSEIRSCAMVTTDANAVMSPIHARMPVILKMDAAEEWLDSTRFSPQELSALLRPFDATLMELYPVSSRVNSPVYDHPSCIAPLEK